MIIGSKIIFIKNLPSTNSHMAELIISERPAEGTIIYTNYQSDGRGQPGNRWESEDGKNLLISILLYPFMVKASDQFLISMAISLGICDFIRDNTHGCSIKWPNDIYIGNDKIAGILIENCLIGDHIENSIAGIGFNLNQEKFLSDAPNPVSLKIVTGQDYNPETSIRSLSLKLDRRYKELISEKYKQIKDEYISNLYRLNEWHRFKDLNGAYTGRIISVTDYGRLKIEKRGGSVMEYAFKEVDFIL